CHVFFFSSRRRHTIFSRDWSSDVCSSDLRFRRGNMGIVFQSFHLIPTMTALENVATPLELAGRRDAFEAAEAELTAIGLGARMRSEERRVGSEERPRGARDGVRTSRQCQQ